MLCIMFTAQVIPKMIHKNQPDDDNNVLFRSRIDNLCTITISVPKLSSATIIRVAEWVHFN